MAEAVSAALSRAEVLLCEAGTGTGKTLAYMLAAVSSGQRVVVSTATKALQDQIVDSDLPRVERALQRSVDVAVGKGLSNYICLRRFEEARRDVASPALRRSLPLIERWVGHTTHGDVSELTELSEDDPALAAVTSSSETRIGPACPYHDRCFVTRMKQRLARAELLVVNHHLFFADLAVKLSAGEAGAQRAGVLPSFDAVIFDEAHRIEDVAATFFGVSLSQARVEALVRDAERAFGESPDPQARDRVTRTGGAVLRAAEDLFGSLGRLVPEAREGRAALAPDALGVEETRDVYVLDEALRVLADFAREHATSKSCEAIAGRAESLARDLDAVVARSTQHVAWLDLSSPKRPVLGATLVDVGPTVREQVVNRLGGVVLTSATLTSVPLGADKKSGFSFLRRRLGLDHGVATEVHELLLESPFDFAQNALLYVPKDLPEVNTQSFVDAAIPRVGELIQLAGGGAFVLTTSRRVMSALGAGLRRETGREVLVQGDAPKRALLEEFRRHGSSVLVATMGFWEGVDVPGDALRLVVIDKLPFAVPTDAVVQARGRALEEEGLDPFAAYSVPEATISLKQGIGRLLRTARDRGVVAILDRRVVDRGYGRRILNALPLGLPVHRLEHVAAFFAKGVR